ncbi:PREDICTED: protein FAM32A-like [Ipomoea nil]|uniref:protein FAM32A-like n=1 Tax=Ipomoea nil TaxID=35883 RepID=UPI0009014D30|nr:PREDICTED: protein FAM32A-like [Ipomoea nil]
MSAYDNVIGGKLKLKGKALDVKASGMKKKKKKQKNNYDNISQSNENELSAGESAELLVDSNQEEIKDANKTVPEGDAARDYLTPAERRYMEQRERIDMQKMAKTANKSHRDRIQDFNQYLANMSEHYDIPKVGPG